MSDILDTWEDCAERLAGKVHQRWMRSGMTGSTPLEDLAIEIVKQHTQLINLVRAKDRALKDVLENLGVPQPGYPAPIGYAYDIAKDGLALTDQLGGSDK